MSSSESIPPELLDTVSNLARFHREHEKFYSHSPLETARTVQTASRALKGLADHWSTLSPEAPGPGPAIRAAADLNDPATVGETGILFLEDDAEPAEIERLRRDLLTLAGDGIETGTWLSGAMEQSWAIAGALAAHPELAEVIAQRHRIIVNDWQAAQMSILAGRLVERALELLGRLELSAPALREDLAGDRNAPRYLFACSELLDRAADLLAESAILIHDNEPRWRAFLQKVESLRP